MKYILTVDNRMTYEYREQESSNSTDWYRGVTRKDGSIMSFDEPANAVTIPQLAKGGRHYVLYATTHLQVFPASKSLS